ncbi:CapA family protein [Lysinibacillus halotolerans]|uniref:CapA family protein n=1 Tax=Lysinibacillus halotolerans TaxID=1368476 RepID=A0A3M8HD77_9BACI|nr:CapA family protein [Lysinibacillus halotolerans]
MFKRYFLFIFILLLVSCAENNISKQPLEKQEQVTPPIQKEPEIYTATINALGDILIHEPIYQEAYIGNNQYNFSDMFAQVKPYLEKADITIANSESIIGGQEIGLSSYPQFNSPYEIGDVLKEVGVDVVNMANNHTLDRGEEAIQNATNYWNKLGITYIGASTSYDEAEQIKTLTVNQITFSFLGYTYGTNGLQVPEGKDYLVNYIDEEKMKKDIEKAKEISDIIVLNLHMGDEYSRNQNEDQEKIAQLAADLGVHIILFHHSHVLQPVKWYIGNTGNQTFAIHSLGNFLSSQDELYRQIGALLELDVKKTITYDKEGKPNTTVEINHPKLLPTYVKFQNWRNYEIIPLYLVTEEQLPNAKMIYDEIKTHMSQYVTNLQFIEYASK